jgi:hypothetical protein
MTNERMVFSAISAISAVKLFRIRLPDFHVPGLFVPKRQMISTEAKLDRIAQRSAANHLNLRAVAKPHLQQPPAKFRFTPHRNDEPATANPQLVQGAQTNFPRMIARAQTAGFFHGDRSCYLREPPYTSDYHPIETEFQPPGKLLIWPRDLYGTDGDCNTIFASILTAKQYLDYGK